MGKRVVIVGGGHNGLTAAAYLARAGAQVTLLERLVGFGGAAISAPAFTGQDARLSRYSYLVSLMPSRIITDLGLPLRLVRRRYSSYTPVAGTRTGLLVDNGDEAATRASFAAVGAADDAQRFADFYRRTTRMGQALFPTVTEPLPNREAARTLVGDAWDDFIEQPISAVVEASVASDLVRGVIATDALIGTFSALDDPGLEQNRCFLYHVIGGGTGDWDVPIGGMGVVSGGLEKAARQAGATLVANAEVVAVDPDGSVTWRDLDGREHELGADLILSGAAPAILDELVTGSKRVRGAGPEGAQVKVNLLLDRLPVLPDRALAPEAAFGGTFHINESYRQLNAAFAAAQSGSVPNPLPCEIYCHSLSDPSILGPELRARGAQTLTVFGLHVPDRLVDSHGNDQLRDVLRQAVVASLNSVLGEPIEDVLATDADGNPCLEVKTTRDISDALAMPGGQIFHGPLSWPWLDEPASGPAQSWGVATDHPRVLICGAGARRGGGVSGLGGHNAAMAAIEMLGLNGPEAR